MEHKDYQGMIVIHGTLYEFDKTNNWLSVHEKMHQHALPEILDWGGEFVSGYAKEGDPVLWPYEDYRLLNQYEQEELKYFEIPREIMIHEKREHLTEQQIQQYNDESLKNNHGFYFVDAALSKRLSGALPEIEFDGTSYIADLANLQITQKERPDIKFELTPSDIYYDADFLYNTSTKTPTRIDPGISEIPKDTVVIRLTNFKDIDTVGFAQYMKVAPTAFVTEKAWYEPKLKAETIPIQQTKIPELIRRNQIEQEKLHNKQTASPQPKRKKGRHL